MENVFNDFWNMRDHDKQNAYLFRQVHANPPKRKYTHSDVSRKKMSYNYYVRSSSGKETKLCRTDFLLHCPHLNTVALR